MKGNLRRLAVPGIAVAVVSGCATMGAVDPALRVDWSVYKALYGTARDLEQVDPEVRAAVLRECGGRDNNGVTYEGATRNGLAHGQGVMAVTFACETAVHYEGQFHAGKPHGRGVMTWAHGQRHEGQFHAGKPHGHGVRTWPDGQRHEGEIRGGGWHGHGVITFPDGTRFEGEFRDDELHGHGVMTKPDGERIEGEWRDGKRVR